MLKKGPLSEVLAVLICLCGLGGHSLAQEQGLVGYWKFDEGRGDMAKDSSGRGNDGKIHNAAWVEGKVGKALLFNGKDAYVDCGNDGSLSLPKAFTIEAWVYPKPGRLPARNIVAKGYKYNANYLLKMGIPWVSNRLMFDVSYQRTQGIEIEYGRWYQIAGVCDGGRIGLFIDGKLMSERPFFHGVKTNSLNVTIGKAIGAPKGGECFSGIIDEVKIYNRVLKKYTLKGQTGADVARKTKTITSTGPWGNYEAFPSVCKSANGDLIVVFYAGRGHMGYSDPSLPKNGRICYMRSTNGGKTWSKPKTLFDSEWGDRDPGITQLKDGTLICAFFRTIWYQNGRVCEVCIVRSFDNGETWESEPVIVPSPWYTEEQKQKVIRTTGPKAVGKPSAMKLEAVCATCSPVRELSDGTLILPIYGFYGKYRASSTSFYGSAIIRSTDKGKTWGDVTIIAPSSPSDRCEPDVIELKDGRLLCVMRPGMEQSISLDKGKTWTKPRELVPFARGHAPSLLQTKDGTIICGYRELPQPRTSVIVSSDGAKTWSRPLLIDWPGGAYPNFVELDDGRILCIYYGEAIGIKQAIFKIKWKPTLHLEIVE